MSTPQHTIEFQRTIIDSLVARIQASEEDNKALDEDLRKKVREALGDDYRGRVNINAEVWDLACAYARLRWLKDAEGSIKECIEMLSQAFGVAPRATLLEMVNDATVAHRHTVGALEQTIAGMNERLQASPTATSQEEVGRAVEREADAVARILEEGFGVHRGRLPRMARDAVSKHLQTLAERDLGVNKDLNAAVDEIHALTQQIKNLEEEIEKKDEVMAELNAKLSFGAKRNLSATEASGNMIVTLSEDETKLFLALTEQHPKDLAEEIIVLRRRNARLDTRVFDMETVQANINSALRDSGYDASVDGRDLLAAILNDACLGRALRGAAPTSEEADFAFGAQTRRHSENPDPEIKRLREQLANVRGHATRQQAELTTIRQLVGAQGKETAVAAVSRYVEQHPKAKERRLPHPAGDFYKALKALAGLEPSKGASHAILLERLQALTAERTGDPWESVKAAHEALARAGIHYTGMLANKIDDLADKGRRAAEQRDEYWRRLCEAEAVTLDARVALDAAGVNVTDPTPLASWISDLAAERDAWRTQALEEIEKRRDTAPTMSTAVGELAKSVDKNSELWAESHGATFTVTTEPGPYSAEFKGWAIEQGLSLPGPAPLHKDDPNRRLSQAFEAGRRTAKCNPIEAMVWIPNGLSDSSEDEKAVFFFHRQLAELISKAAGSLGCNTKHVGPTATSFHTLHCEEMLRRAHNVALVLADIQEPADADR